MNIPRPYKSLLIEYDDDKQRAEVLITRDDDSSVTLVVPNVSSSMLKWAKEHDCPTNPYGGCCCDPWMFGYLRHALTLRLEV